MDLPPTGRKARFGLEKIKSKIPFRPSSAARPTAVAVASSGKEVAAQSSQLADTAKADKKFSPICELWNEAYDDFQQKEESLAKEYEAILSVPSSIRLSDVKLQRKEQMNNLLQTKMEEVNKNTWRLRFGTKDVLIKDLVQPVVNIISSANGFIQDTLTANPYASLAWAGVSVILPVFLNPSKQAASLTSSLEYISGLIVQSAMREELYRRRYELNIDREDYTGRIFDSNQSSCGTFANSHAGYRDTLKELYVRILRFQATGVCYFSRKGLLKIGSDIIKWDGWDSLLTDIKTQEASFTNINDIWRDAKYEEDCASIEKRHQESMKNLISIGSDISCLRRAVDDAQRERDRSGLLEWLSAVNPSQNYNLARDRHEPNTGEWLIRDNDIFKAWESLPHSFLWLHGKAGSGKSILSSSIIKDLRDNHESDPNTALAYFYFSFSDTTKQDVAEMLCCLIKQICCRRPDIPKPFGDLRNFKNKGHRPDTETLDKTLGAVISGFSDVYVVIDALDECPVSNGERERLLDNIDHILSMETSQNLHLLCTSRNEYDIAAVLQPFCSGPGRAYIDLSTNSAAIETDIGRYIDNKLNAPWYRVWSPQIKTLARETLVQKSNCMFQYVVCQFNELSKLSSPKEIMNALDDLPEGLDATYDRMLQSIDPKHQTQVANLLKWLAFAERPLTVQELAEIFTLYPDQEVPFDEDNRFFEPDDVLKYLPGLITTSETLHAKVTNLVSVHHDEDGDPQRETHTRNIATRPNERFIIQLVHFSFKEYLVSQRIACGRSAKFSTSDLDGHLHISKSCLAYHLHISHTNVANANTVRRFPLLQYAAAYWLNHMESAGRQNWPADASERLRTALLAGSKSFLNLGLIRTYYVYRFWTRNDGNIKTPLGFVCGLERELPQVVRSLIESGVDVNATSCHGTTCTPALYCAVLKEHETIARILLENGADVNEEGGEYGYALQVAAESGDKAIVELLLAHGANVNAKGGEYGYALQAAADSGHKAIVELLLAHGADVNAEGGFYGCALQAAAGSGDKAIVELLLAHGADVNVKGGDYGHALQAAVYVGDKAIVELLLARGADVNAKGGDYGHALQVAAESGDKAIVELLLAHGADVNAEGGFYRHALQAAAYYGHKAIVELLLAHGADFNAKGRIYGNALQTAIVSRNKDRDIVIAILVSEGATLDPPGEQWDALLENLLDKSPRHREDVVELRRCQENPKMYFEKLGIIYPR